jgi:hypothetical protein
MWVKSLSDKGSAFIRQTLVIVFINRFVKSIDKAAIAFPTYSLNAVISNEIYNRKYQCQPSKEEPENQLGKFWNAIHLGKFWNAIHYRRKSNN